METYTVTLTFEASMDREAQAFAFQTWQAAQDSAQYGDWHSIVKCVATPAVKVSK